jgi:3-oxoacyl-[acyl-carrier protein] reductase
MAKRLAGQVAAVTGASKGIGASIAKHLAAEGASVVVNYASSKEGAGRAVGETMKAFGRLDILVNNAAVYEFSPIEGVNGEHFRKTFNLNVFGLILSSQEAAKHFSSAGGSIVNIRSLASTLTPPNSSVCSGTKAAVDAVTKSLAKELGPRKIRVNAINPGMVESEGVHAAGFTESDFRKQVEPTTPLGRIGQPEDIVPVAVFLASPDSAWITGETLVVAGEFRCR